MLKAVEEPMLMRPMVQAVVAMMAMAGRGIAVEGWTCGGRTMYE